MQTVRTVEALRECLAPWRGGGQSIGLVPTMGAIHEGHLALVEAARGACDRVVTSLFVNPAQFGPNEDFDRYPRDEVEDAHRIERGGTDVLFAPSVATMYPDGFSTTITVAGLSSGLCGDYRPGHFQGVATVVGKLLIQCGPDRAYFGEKDYQQLMVIRRLARDLDLATVIEGVPIVREADGLALSSRNVYLSEDHRAAAPALFRTIVAMAGRLADGRTAADEQVDWGIAQLVDAGFDRLDYLEVRDAETLDRIETVSRPARVIVAAHLGGTRLIDNVPVMPVS